MPRGVFIVSTYPFRCLKQLNHSFADISTPSPRLRLISCSPDGYPPLIGIHREFGRYRTHIGLILLKEVVHEPAVVEQRPFNTSGFLENLAEWGSRRTVYSRMHWEVVNIAGELGSNKTFASRGSFASPQVRTMDVNEAFIRAVVERYEGACFRCV